MNRRTFVKTTGIVTASCGTLSSGASGHRSDGDRARTSTDVKEVSSERDDHEHAYYVNVTTW